MASDQGGMLPPTNPAGTLTDGLDHVGIDQVPHQVSHHLDHSSNASQHISIDSSIDTSTISTAAQQQLVEHLRQFRHLTQALDQSQLHSVQFGTEAGDANHDTLSAISAFNASYPTNTWGKRTADGGPLDEVSSPSKRQHIDAHHQQALGQDAHLQLDHSQMDHPPLHNSVNYPVNVSVNELQAAVAAVAEQHQQQQQHQRQQQQEFGQQQQFEQQHRFEQQQFEQQQQHFQQQQQQEQIIVSDEQDHIHNGGHRLQSEEAEYEDDEELEGSPFQAHQDHLMNPFGHQHEWTIPTNLMDDSTAVLWSANHGMRVRSLPVVDNLSTQILMTLGKGGYQETLNIVTCPESDSGQAYSLLKALFDQTKKIYTTDAFLNCEELKLESPEQRAIIRKVNLATFVSSVFGSQEVGFFHLNECFLDTFIPEGGRLLKSQGALYLDLKTQAYISALSTGERDRMDILNDLFPDDMAHYLLLRRPGAKGLTPSEADFVQRAHQRKQHLMQLPEDTALSEKYVWQDFLQDVSSYVSKHFDQIMAQPVRKNRKRQSSHGVHRPAPTSSYQAQPHYSTMTVQMPIQPGVVEHQQQRVYEISQHPTADDVDATTAAALSAHNAAHTAAQQQFQQHQELASDHSQQQIQQLQSPEIPPTPELYDPNVVQHHLQSHDSTPVANMTMNLGHPPVVPPSLPAQTTPTQVLYERARLAAQSKASPNARRSGLPSQRRPWTPEEETALMAGLDRVKGPHWSQILAMFGPGGTINEVLKDRNQVQLKDKARNLKLFFLKSGIEVPYYLQFVTGELKTRAPSQAAKQQKLKQQMAAKAEGGSSQYSGDGNISSDEDSGTNSEAQAQARAQAQAHIDAVNALNGEINRQDSLNMHHQQALQQAAEHHHRGSQDHHLGSQEMLQHDPNQHHHHHAGLQDGPVGLNGMVLDANSVAVLGQAIMMQHAQQQKDEAEQQAQLQQQIDQLERMSQQQAEAEAQVHSQPQSQIGHVQEQQNIEGIV